MTPREEAELQQDHEIRLFVTNAEAWFARAEHKEEEEEKSVWKRAFATRTAESAAKAALDAKIEE